MEPDLSLLRNRMIEEQLVPRGIKNAQVLASMQEVPRHFFVPAEERRHAYDDSPLPIGHHQTISQPYIVALMTEAASVSKDSVVLEIGTGSGYAAAVLSRIVNTVCTVERIEELAQEAEKKFHKLKYENIHVKFGDGTLGWSEKSPFDAILVTAGAPIVPEALKEQLKPGGRLVIPVGDHNSQKLWRYTKMLDGSLSQELIEYVRFVPLIGLQGW